MGFRRITVPAESTVVGTIPVDPETISPATTESGPWNTAGFGRSSPTGG